METACVADCEEEIQVYNIILPYPSSLIGCNPPYQLGISTGL